MESYFFKRSFNLMNIPCILFLLFLHSFSIILFGQESSPLVPKTISDFKKQPTINWEFKTTSAFYASPVVDDGLIYVGGLDGNLYAINIETGKEVWKFHTRGEIRSDALIHNDDLYLNGGDGTLYSLNKKNGEISWLFKTGGEKKYDFADYFQSSPIYENGKVYFGSGDGNLYGVNATTGTLSWSYQTSGIIHTKPAISKNKIFFGSFDGHVYGINLSTGKLIWKFKTVGHKYFPLGEVQGSPTLLNNLVFIGARDYNIYALDQEKGYCHWNKAFTRGWGLNSSINDSILYIGSADERVLLALDPTTGEEFWNKSMEFLVFGNNVYSQNMLYMGTTIGKLHGIDLKTGQKVWSYETDTYKQNRFKYFKQDDSYRDDIYSIIKSNEQFLEVECELGGIFSTPYISENIIIFSSTNGTLYCLKRE